MSLFVAVVFKAHDDTYPKSHRPEGGFEAFVGTTEKDAVTQATLAAQRWETDTTKKYGPYQILVGELSQEVERFKYKLVPIDLPF